MGSSVPTTVLATGDLSINNTQIAASVSDGVSYQNASASALAKATAINAASGLTGVTATVGQTTLNGVAATTPTTAVNAGDVFINGVAIGAIGVASSAIDRGTQTAAAINAKSSQTGVTATASTSTGVVTLLAADGRNITVSSTTNGGTGTGLISTYTGTGAATNVSVASGTFVLNGVNITPAVSSAATATAFGTAMATAINEFSASTGVVASSTDGILTLSVRAGSAGTGYGAAGGIDTTGTAAGVLTALGLASRNSVTTAGIQLSTQGSNGIVLGGNAGTVSTGQGSTGSFTASVLSSTGGVDLSTATGSQAALTVLDKAINTVTDSRASMGAYQNRLTASVANLETTSMNLQASRSRILDTDYAKETTNLAKSQIIQQAATAMLAQANQSAQSVLALLK